ncbi:unnamed protein product [Aureobasidium uvarum]|uniref:Fungal STAND N-terminal Goodbye domain-containing protein n=1 Tax=Aureobasidium uvarum TaxID=2773716 RepID=A0A9N8KG96_9PEZI|nr:unnamed protein product [Aureobasidium uvarum]
MSTTTPPLRKRDRLKNILPGRPKPVSPGPLAATVSSSSSQDWPQSASVASTFNSTAPLISSPSASISTATPTLQQATLVTSTVSSPTISSLSTNPAFLAAIQKHLDKVPQVERQAFYQANITISPDSLLERIRSLDTQHASNSSFRPCTDRIAKCLGLLDRLLGGVAIAVQANPDISSIAVGGVKLIVDIAVGFAKFFGKLADMLDRFSEIIAPLERYSERFELLNVGHALIDVYGDVLDFCKASSALFLDRDGRSKSHTTLQMFLHSQWAPFEMEFGEIAGRMDRHCGVLLHAAQAELLYADKGKNFFVPDSDNILM